MFRSQKDSQKLKYKIMKIEKGVQYIGRLNIQLSHQEILNDFKFASNARIEPTKDIVKLSLKAQKPGARDLYTKLVYDQVRKRNRGLFDMPDKLILKQSQSKESVKEITSKNSSPSESVSSRSSSSTHISEKKIRFNESTLMSQTTKRKIVFLKKKAVIGKVRKSKFDNCKTKSNNFNLKDLLNADLIPPSTKENTIEESVTEETQSHNDTVISKHRRAKHQKIKSEYQKLEMMRNNSLEALQNELNNHIQRTVEETNEISKDMEFIYECKEIVSSFHSSLDTLATKSSSKYAIKIFDGLNKNKKIVFTSNKAKDKIILKK